MGFKIENYTHKCIRVCVYIIVSVLGAINLHSQAPHCPIGVELEPVSEETGKSPNQFGQIPFPIFSSWNNLNALKSSNDKYATIQLDGVKRSTVLRGSTLGFNLPEGAQIEGIELFFEGQSFGQGAIEDVSIKIVDGAGNAISENKAGTYLPSDRGWAVSPDSTDYTWRYGNKTDNWGINLQNLETNNQNFGFEIQIRNKLSAPIEVQVDHIFMVIHYTPLYAICSEHACVPFFIQELNEEYTYEWYWPQGFELISDSEHDPVINIGVSYAEFGIYEICSEAFKDDVSQGICCRTFEYKTCSPGSIGDQVFLDKNANAQLDNADDALEGITINLYQGNGTYVTSTATDADGRYLFEDVQVGQYYIEAESIDSLQFTFANQGDDASDSDITNENGLGTSSTFTINPDQDITNLDIGYAPYLTIGDYVWLDRNGDGIQNDDESGIADISITATNVFNNQTNITTTDNQGFYIFENLIAGEYTIQFSHESTYVSTQANQTDNALDSDIDNDGIVTVSIPMGAVLDTIDAGFYLTSTIGDYIWLDANKNGIQDEDESGIEGISIALLSYNGDTISTTQSDINGYYNFDGIAPGIYSMAILDNDLYDATEVNAVQDSTIDNDASNVDMQVVVEEFQLLSGTIDTTLDIGLEFRNSSIGGFLWDDNDADGQFNLSDVILENELVMLYQADGNFVDSTRTDILGFYQFDELAEGMYYLVFDSIDNYLFTNPDAVDDAEDSDVTSSIVTGSTDIFSTVAGVDDFSFFAGYTLKPSLGGYAWKDNDFNGIFEDFTDLLPGIPVSLYDESGNLEANITTDEFGLYLFPYLMPGEYYVVFDSLEGNLFTLQNQGTDENIDSDVDETGTTEIYNLVAGQDVLDIAAGYTDKPSLGGLVWNDSNFDGIRQLTESLKENIKVILFNTSGMKIDSAFTDMLGNYSFNNQEPGEYFLVFESVSTDIFTLQNQGGDDEFDSDVDAFGVSEIITLVPGQNAQNIDAGYTAIPGINGFTWFDANYDGSLQADELPAEGVKVKVLNSSGEPIDSTVTGALGIYMFSSLSPGSYYIVFEDLPDYQYTLVDQGMNDNLDSDVNSFFTRGSTSLITIIPGTILPAYSAGYVLQPKVGDYVWLDTNKDGIQDEAEIGLNGVEINLYNSANELVETTTSANNPETGELGYYLFENLTEGEYYIEFVSELVSTLNDPSSPLTNSDITNQNGPNTTDLFSLSGNICNFDIDAGFFLEKGSICGEVWIDENENDTQDLTEELLSGVSVNLYNADGTLANTLITANGQYSFENLEEGTYYVTFDVDPRYTIVASNVGTDATIDSDVIAPLEDGRTADIIVVDGIKLDNIDVGLIDGISPINGFTWIDNDGNGLFSMDEAPLPNTKVYLHTDASTIIDSTLTDAMGQYQFSEVEPDDYFIRFSPESDVYLATDADAGDDAIDSDITSSIITNSTDIFTHTYFQASQDIDGGFYEPASIGDFVFIDYDSTATFTAGDAGLDGVLVELYDSDGELIASDITAAGGGQDSGYYFMDNIKPGMYQLQFTRPSNTAFVVANMGTDDSIDSDVTSENFNIGFTEFFSLVSGESNTEIDAGVQFVTIEESSIMGVVWEDSNADGIRQPSEALLPFTGVELLNENNMVEAFLLTNAMGEYLFDSQHEGNYTIRAILTNGRLATLKDIGMDDSIDSDFFNDNGSILTDQFFLDAFEIKVNVDLGVVESLTIGDFVWEDTNNNGIQDAGEPGVENIEVTAADISGQNNYSTFTNSNGAYTFDMIPAGNYRICIAPPAGYSLAMKDAGGDDALDSDAGNGGCTDVIDFSSGGLTNDIDFGLTIGGQISGLAFIDFNGNGRLNGMEPGFEGIDVSLYLSDGTFVSSTPTANLNGVEGAYQFLSVSPGEYYVEFDFPEEYIITTPDNGDDNIDSDITEANGPQTTDVFTMNSGTSINNIFGGVFLPAQIGDQVWLDLNMDGINDPGEPGVEGIEVVIKSNAGIPIDTTLTEEDGFYIFDDLKQGLYFIHFKIPDIYTISPQDTLLDDSVDSDADETGLTSLVSLAHGTELLTMDCGIFESTANLRSVVWEDENGDGIRQMDEPRVNDMVVYLYSNTGVLIDSTTSNYLGYYAFQDMEPGNVYIQASQNEEEYYFTDDNNGEDDMMDSDVDENGKSAIFKTSPSLNVPNIDIGIMPSGGVVGVIVEQEQNIVSQETGSSNNVTTRYPQPTVMPKINIHPNPAVNYIKLTIDDHEAEGWITIRNQENKVVLHQEIRRESEIDIHDLHPGVYFVTLTNGKTIATKKIIKVQ